MGGRRLRSSGCRARQRAGVRGRRVPAHPRFDRPWRAVSRGGRRPARRHTTRDRGAADRGSAGGCARSPRRRPTRHVGALVGWPRTTPGNGPRGSVRTGAPPAGRATPGSMPDPHRGRPGYHPHMTDQATILFRPAAPADAEAIAAMFTDEGYPAGPSDIIARLDRFDTPEARVIVAEHDGALLGFIAIHALPRFEHDDSIVRILALVVDAGARERGVRRALMAEAERVGRELGAAFIELTAGHHRPEARQLYETLGYDSSVTAYLRKKLCPRAPHRGGARAPRSPGGRP